MPTDIEAAILAGINGSPTERESALRRLYHLDNCYLRKAIVAYICQKGGDKSEGEDICHDAFIIADRCIRAQKFRGESTLKTYVVAIGKWLWWNELRRKKPSPNFEREPEDWSLIEKSVEHQFLDEERKAAVFAAIETLPLKCKEVLLQYDLGYSAAEISASLNHPSQKYTENTLYRCLDKLKQMFNSPKTDKP